VGVVVLLSVVAIAVEASFTPSSPSASANVYVDPQGSSCKGGATFSCTIVLAAKQGSLDVSSVKSVQINGTNTQPAFTATGSSLTILATLPSITMQHGLADVGPAVSPPSVGSVVVYLSDGTSVSVLLGPGGILR
jgi:hypothetical protein